MASSHQSEIKTVFKIMTKNNIAAVVLAAGMGTRMKSSIPKVMHKIAGRPMLKHLLATLEEINARHVVVVIGSDMEHVSETIAPHKTAIQHERLGTAHAVATAKKELENFDGDILILFGDTPLIKQETLEKMLKARRAGASVVVLGFTPDDAAQYGRLIVGDKGLEAIVEYKDANAEQRQVNLCNSGVMCVNGSKLYDLIDKVDNSNASGEYYLTDIIEIACNDGLKCTVVEGEVDELLGVNSKKDLAEAESIAQKRLREKAMENGATLIAPETVHFSYDTVIGRDVVISPFVVFGLGVTIADNVEIKGFCHFEQAVVSNGALLGPYARLRPGAEIGENAHIGNFVEIKKARVEKGAKVNHLSYIGDARVGSKANIGAGTITCNYDGFGKYYTDIGEGAFIGSNTALVAPVSIGDGAITGAGSVITKDVEANALALTRAKQQEKSGWAAKFRKIKQAKKDAKKN